MKKIFHLEESPYHPGKYCIQVDCDEFHLDSTKGSFNIICARLLNISYASYLRLCRDSFGAEVFGKGSMYPVPYFTRSAEVAGLVENLNARAKMVLWEREHQDYSAHENVVRELNPNYYSEVRGE